MSLLQISPARLMARTTKNTMTPLKATTNIVKLRCNVFTSALLLLTMTAAVSTPATPTALIRVKAREIFRAGPGV